MFRNIGVILLGSLWIVLGSPVYGSEATADQHTARAVQLVKEGKDKEALEEFTKAIEADSKNPMFYRNRAALYSRMKGWEHAARCGSDINWTAQPVMRRLSLQLLLINPEIGTEALRSVWSESRLFVDVR